LKALTAVFKSRLTTECLGSTIHASEQGEGVPWRQPHRRLGLATLTSVVAIP